MFVIRQEQIDAMWRTAVRPSEDRLLAHVAKHFPRPCAFLGEEQVRLALRHGIRRAQSHRLDRLPAICLWVSVAFMLGSDFDEDPQLPWVRPLLWRPGDARARALRLFDEAVRHLDRVDGEDPREHARCLLRARRLDLPALERRLAAGTGATGELLAELQPRKWAVLGEGALRQLIRRGEQSAAAAGLASATGRAVHTTLMSFLGEHYRRDPLCPWAQQALAHLARGESACVARLHAGAMRYLDAILGAAPDG